MVDDSDALVDAFREMRERKSRSLSHGEAYQPPKKEPLEIPPEPEPEPPAAPETDPEPVPEPESVPEAPLQQEEPEDAEEHAPEPAPEPTGAAAAAPVENSDEPEDPPAAQMAWEPADAEDPIEFAPKRERTPEEDGWTEVESTPSPSAEPHEIVPSDTLARADPSTWLQKLNLEPLPSWLRESSLSGKRHILVALLAVAVLGMVGSQVLRIVGYDILILDISLIWYLLAAAAGLMVAVLASYLIRTKPIAAIRMRETIPERMERSAREIEQQRTLMTVSGILFVPAFGACAFLLLSHFYYAVGLGILGFVLLIGYFLFRAGSRHSRREHLYLQLMAAIASREVGQVAKPSIPDARVDAVLLKLDDLLGELPDASVEQFLSSKEADWYLELIEEVKR